MCFVLFDGSSQIRLLNGQNACETHLIFVDAAFVVDGHAEWRQLDFVVEHASHDIAVALAQSLHCCHAET